MNKQKELTPNRLALYFRIIQMLPFCCHEGKSHLTNGFAMRNLSGFRLFPLLDFDRILRTPYSTNRITKRFSLYLVFILYKVFQILVSKRYHLLFSPKNHFLQFLIYCHRWINKCCQISFEFLRIDVSCDIATFFYISGSIFEVIIYNVVNNIIVFAFIKN